MLPWDLRLDRPWCCGPSSIEGGLSHIHQPVACNHSESGFIPIENESAVGLTHTPTASSAHAGADVIADLVMWCSVEFSFEPVLRHIHALSHSALPHSTHNRNGACSHLLVELRHALLELECRVFQMPGSHRHIVRATDILMHNLDRLLF